MCKDIQIVSIRLNVSCTKKYEFIIDEAADIIILACDAGH